MKALSMSYYHVTIAVATLLQMTDDELTGMLTLDGEPLTPHQARVSAAHFQARGFVYLPVCENVDARGMCHGHAVKTDDGTGVTMKCCGECGNPVSQSEIRASPFPNGGNVCTTCYRNESQMLGAEE